MQRLTAGLAVLGVAMSGYLAWQNHRLRGELRARQAGIAAERGARALATTAGPPAAEARGWGWQRPSEAALPEGPRPPTLEGQADESRLERRARRQEQIAQLLGRLPGETDDEYRARVMPLANVWIDRARKRADEMLTAVAEKAQLSAAQRQQIDQAIAPAYDEFIAYTNAAITDGQLSPYDVNVTGMLEYAGGLGPLLSQTEGAIGQVLTPAQRQIFASSGFEWGEYLWAYAPWDRLTPPPPPP